MARSDSGLVCLCSSVVHLSTLYKVVMVAMVMVGCKYYRTYLAVVLLGKVGIYEAAGFELQYVRSCKRNGPIELKSAR